MKYAFPGPQQLRHCCCCCTCFLRTSLMLFVWCTYFTAGLGNTIAPMYLSEIAPFNYRGAFGTLHQLLITGGIFLSSVFGLKELLGIHKSHHLMPSTYRRVPTPMRFNCRVESRQLSRVGGVNAPVGSRDPVNNFMYCC